MSAVEAAIEALAAQDADLDLDHVEPGGVLWRVVELQVYASGEDRGRIC